MAGQAKHISSSFDAALYGLKNARVRAYLTGHTGESDRRIRWGGAMKQHESLEEANSGNKTQRSKPQSTRP